MTEAPRASKPPRLLIYGMQSSGASCFCWFIGQRPDSIAIIDVWVRNITPWIDTSLAIVAKATVTVNRTLDDHRASFRPDRTILFLRDPVATWASLRNYNYATRFGTIEEKLGRLDREFTTGRHDAVIRYEDFVARDPAVFERLAALDWPARMDWYDGARVPETIAAFNMAASPWLAAHRGDGWDLGNLRPGPIRQDLATRPDLPELAEAVERVAPALAAAYRGYWGGQIPK